MTTSFGWGGGPWGGPTGTSGGAWGGVPGGASSTALQVVSAVAIAENVLQVTFTAAVYYSGVLDPGDGSLPALYSVVPVAGTSGLDGQAARPLMVVATAPVLPAGVSLGTAPTQVNLTTDRPMTPWPAQYTVAVGQVLSADKTQFLSPAASTGTTPAVFMLIQRPNIDSPAPGRDLANPITQQAAQNSNISLPAQAALGSFGYSDNGDYALDSRDDGLRKRLNRRLFSKKGGFLHLGKNYGIDAPSYLKKLAKASERDRLTSDVNSQFAREPEVAKANAFLRQDPLRPALWRLDTFVQKRSGQNVKYSSLFPAQ